MSLLDADRFEGRFRDAVHVVDVSDLMRRPEAALYHEVTQYVQNEFNRADQLEGGRRNAVGLPNYPRPMPSAVTLDGEQL